MLSIAGGGGVGGTATAMATTTAIRWEHANHGYGNASQTARTAQIHSWLPPTHSHGLLNAQHVDNLDANNCQINPALFAKPFHRLVEPQRDRQKSPDTHQ